VPLAPIAAVRQIRRASACLARTGTTLVANLPALVSLLVLARPADAQVAGRSAEDCRRFASALTHGTSDSAWHMALASIYDCPNEVGPTLASLWQVLPADSVRRHQLFFVSAHIHDAHLYHQLVAMARNGGIVDSVRFHAIEVLVTVADSTLLIEVSPPLGPAIPDSAVPRSGIAIGGFSHPFARSGRHLLPHDVRDSVVELLRTLSRTDSSPDLRYVARRAHDWLTHRSPP
jgi:hypothetical protein